ncbi:hypothetical protein [Pseudomonas sp. D(2018)]|uniref:hypothetical protein n=1 Tax=Pseudomonas sp. D(2018) TaxID=2502238 RepID=UPI0010F70C23|nr:hypothetical protein [Pseudomonas sp. D(2018)]
MTSHWDLGALKNKVVATQAGDTKELVDLIYAMGRYQQIFEYHKCLARDAFAAFSTDSGPDQLKFLTHAFGCVSPEEQGTLEHARLVSEANLLACIGITRSAFDSFGELLNRLVLPVPLNGKVYVHTVRDKLPSGELKDSLDSALSASWFTYVSDFSNVSKHRALIGHTPSASYIDDNQGGKVASFTYENRGKPRTHPSYWTKEILEGTIEVWRSLVLCGLALNRHYI